MEFEPGRGALVPGDVLEGTYQVLGELGAGGFGSVYRARDLDTQRVVAVKLLHTGDGESAERFEREALLAAQVGTGEGVVKVHSRGTWQGKPYLIMECVEGPTLYARIKRGDLSSADALRIVESVARTMQAVHTAGVLHRDIKPSNILLPEVGPPKLVDFGLARSDESERLTTTGQMLGTPVYMPPEQLAVDRDVDARGDVYSLGATLYHALTGVPPFQGTLPELLHFLFTDRAPSPPSVHRAELPAALDAICVRALQKDPDQRYPSAQAFADDLARAARGEAVEARLPSRGRRRLVLGAVGALACAALIVPVALILWSGSGDSPEAKPEDIPARAEDPWRARARGLRQVESLRERFAACDAWLADSPDGHASAADVRQVRERLVRAPLCSLDQESVRDTLWVSADQVLAADDSGVLLLWDLPSERAVREWSNLPTAYLADAPSAFALAYRGGLQVLDRQTLETRMEAPGYGGRAVAIAEDASRVAVVSWPRGLTVFDVATGEALLQVAMEDGYALAFAEDADVLAVGRSDGRHHVLELRRLPSGELLREVAVPAKPVELRRAPGSLGWVVADGGGGLRRIPPEGEPLIFRADLTGSSWTEGTAHVGRVADVLLVGDAVLSVSAARMSRDPRNDLAVWSLGTGALSGRFLERRDSRISSLSLSPDGREVLVVFQDLGRMQVWATARFTE